VVRLLLLRRVSLKHSSSSNNNRLNSRASKAANSKVSSKAANSQYDPAFPCLVVVDAEEVELMCLQASVQPVALKRADMAMLVAEDEEDAAVAVVE
jgi:hypothetical protein